MLSEKDLQDLNTAATLIISIIERHNVRDEDATERRALFRLLTNETPPDVGDADGEEAKNGIIEFTEKEIAKMPKYFQKYFRIDGIKVPYRKKKNGVYELRCTINKQHYYGASVVLKTAKARFIESLRSAPNPTEQPSQARRKTIPTVEEYALHYFETFKKPTICEKGYENYVGATKRHVLPMLGKLPINELTATDCQNVLNAIVKKGYGRTGETVNSVLRWICDAAMADGYLKTDPMRTTKILKHYRTSGKQIPSALVREYLSKEPQERYDYLIRFLFFTGLRPAEIKTVRFEGDFFVVKNAKERTGAPPTYRRLPVHSSLKAYVSKIEEALSYSSDALNHKFKRRFPEYALYDTRHTFTSRVQECGANKEWVDYVTNHKGAMNVTTRVYTHWSDEFSILQIEMLEY